MTLAVTAALFTLILGLVSLTDRKFWIAILAILAFGLQVFQIVKDNVDTETIQNISDTDREKIIEEVLKARVQIKRLAEMLPAKEE